MKDFDEKKMTLKKVKRKRKNSLKESNEVLSDEDKYLAYTKKSANKKKIHSQCNKGQSSSKDCTSPDRKKKRTKKSQLECEENTEIDELVDTNKCNVIISAKPKIYKDTVKLNVPSNTDCKISKASKKVEKKGTILNKKMSKKHFNQHNSSGLSGITLITPQIMPDLDILMSSNSSPTNVSFDQSTTSSSDDSTAENLPIIVEANLKKSSNSYIPEALKDHKQTIIESESETYKLSKTDSSKEKKPKSSEISAKKSVKQCNSETINSEQDINGDIPQALQEFYNEITQGFEILSGAQLKPKNTKKKSILTVDESLRDCNLEEVIHRNDVYMNNSVLLNQENVAHFFSLENKVILVLWPQTVFSFLGKLRLTLLYGAIELYGSIFSSQNTDEPVEVYSPRGYSSISISTSDVEGTYNKEALWDALTIEGVDRSLKTKLHDTINQCKKGWSVLLLENFENTLTNFLNSHCSFKLWPKIDNLKYSWCDIRRAEFVLRCNFQFYKAENEISINSQWNVSITNQLLDQWNSTKSLRTMVIGGKGVGKSTTTRYLINSFLRHAKKVVLIDLDPGQAEMTPAASVSLNVIDKPLLGPNFTHLKTPFHQLYLDDINVVNCLNRYIDCIKKLVEYLNGRKDLMQYPIIINTMGFCKGIGLDICVFLIKLLDPSNVIQILSKKPKNNFDYALLKQNVNERKNSSMSWNDNAVLKKCCDYELHYVPSMAEGKRQFETWNMEPRQQRELVLLSYLSQIIQNADDTSFCNLVSNSINNIIPYELPFSSFYVSLMKSNTSPTHILAAMNGNIVALCGLDLDDETPATEKKSLKYPLVVIRPPPCACYGYGIVRGVDMNRRCVYINTPLDAVLLRHVNLLAGCSAVPFALLDSGEQANAPYKADRGELPTSREARRGYFRVDQTKSTNS